MLVINHCNFLEFFIKRDILFIDYKNIFLRMFSNISAFPNYLRAIEQLGE